MSRIIVNITDDLDQIPDLETLLPKEVAHAGQLKEQGILEHLFIKEDRTGAVLVMKDIDVAKAKDLVAAFPMFKYFDQVDYTVAEKPF
jgi:muconolactone delta-isomerase